MSFTKMVTAVALCPTYNRAELLREAVQSFLLQDYPNKLMIILNDCLPQNLVSHIENVWIFNHSARFLTLGEKRKHLLHLAPLNTICFPWDDDDISLPHRMSQGIERLGNGGYWNPRQSFYYPREGLSHTHKHGCTHNASCFRREYAVSKDAYDIIANENDDQIADMRLGRTENPLNNPAEWSYLYRWGVSDHISSKCRKNPVHETGKIVIEPHWRIDYRSLVNDYLIRAGYNTTHDSPMVE